MADGETRLLTLARNTARLCNDLGYGELAGRIEIDAGGSADRPANVVVVGEKKRGKSSLLNALVGERDLLPVDADVATSCFLTLRHGAGERVVAHDAEHPDGVEIGRDEIAEYASVEGNRDPDDDERLLHEGVTSVDVELDDPLLARGLVLVDTPGVGGLEAGHTEVTLATLRRADALVFVVDPDSPLRTPELRFLERATERIATVVFVMTKIDLYPGWQRILDDNRELVARHAPAFAGRPWAPVSSELRLEALELAARGDDARSADMLSAAGSPRWSACSTRRSSSEPACSGSQTSSSRPPRHLTGWPRASRRASVPRPGIRGWWTSWRRSRAASRSSRGTPRPGDSDRARASAPGPGAPARPPVPASRGSARGRGSHRGEPARVRGNGGARLPGAAPGHLDRDDHQPPEGGGGARPRFGRGVRVRRRGDPRAGRRPSAGRAWTAPVTRTAGNESSFIDSLTPTMTGVAGAFWAARALAAVGVGFPPLVIFGAGALLAHHVFGERSRQAELARTKRDLRTWLARLGEDAGQTMAAQLRDIVLDAPARAEDFFVERLREHQERLQDEIAECRRQVQAEQAERARVHADAEARLRRIDELAAVAAELFTAVDEVAPRERRCRRRLRCRATSCRSTTGPRTRSPWCPRRPGSRSWS